MCRAQRSESSSYEVVTDNSHVDTICREQNCIIAVVIFLGVALAEWFEIRCTVTTSGNGAGA